jgi:hypothetical protein
MAKKPIKEISVTPREEYVKKTGIQYDVVVYLRADMYFMSRVVFEIPRQNTVYIPSMDDHNGVCDQMAYGTLETMKKYAATYTNLKKYLQDEGAYCHPETLTLHNIRSHKLDIVRFNLIRRLDSNRTT